jgi:hypothetical protein
MQTYYDILDFIFYRAVYPLLLFIRSVFDGVFLGTMTFLSIPYSVQVVIIAILTVCFAFGLRKWLNVEAKEKVFRKKFVAQKAERDNIAIVAEKKQRDAMYNSADQSIDEDFNVYLAQHYFRYVLIYLLPLFLVMAWLNNSLDERVLTRISGQNYLYLTPSHPFGIEGVSVTLLYLLSYVISLIAGFQIKKRCFSKKAKE